MKLSPFIHNCLFCMVVFLLSACQSEKLHSFSFQEKQMGVDFKYFVYAEDQQQAQKAVEAAMDRVEQLNQCFSDYIVDSELWQLSESSGKGEAVKVSEDMWHVLRSSIKFHALSDGAFDITAGPYFLLWRQARVIKKIPSARFMAKAANKVGVDKIDFDTARQMVTLKAAGMRLDLGGIAKGYAADEALKTILSHGIKYALVDASGDIAMTNSPLGTWKVYVSDGEKKESFIELKSGAVATSGDASQFVEIGGKRYSHIVNPKTGIGMTNRCRVTVLAADCETADALASTVTVLGSVEGLKLVEGLDEVEAMIQQAENGEIKILKSSGFPELQD